MHRDNHRRLVLLIAPALVLLVLLAVYPVVRVAVLSLFETEYGLDGAVYVGLDNYRTLAGDRFFTRSALNTLHFTVAASLTQVGLGLAIALLLDRPFPGRRLVLPLVVVPLMLSTMVVAAIWRSWFHYDFGFLNALLGSVGLDGVGWLFDRDLTLWSIILVDVWQYTPLTVLILLAGLSAVPREVVEAARIDGAGRWRIFRTITLPLLAGPLALALLLRTVDTFKIFDKVYALTGGGPGLASEVLSLFVYENGFRFANVGIASAAAMVMVVIAGALAAVYATWMLRSRAR